MDWEITIKINIPFKNFNDIFLPLIRYIAKYTDVRGYVERVDDTIVIMAQEKEDKIKNFIDKLGRDLPLSIFMEEAKVEIIDNSGRFDVFSIKNEILNILPVNYGLCPACVEELLNQGSRRYLYPFISCKYCGSQYSYLFFYPFERENTIFRYFTRCQDCESEYNDENSRRYKYPLTSCYNCFIPASLYTPEYKEFIALNSQMIEKMYHILLKYLSENKEVVIKTSNGYKNLSNTYSPSSYLLFLNPEIIDDIVHISQKEFKLLASIEKPLVKLSVKEEFKNKENLPLNFVFGKLPDDPVFVGLSKFSKEYGIDYLFMRDSEEYGFNENLRFDFDLKVENPQRDLKVAIVQGKKLVLEGEKGIFPMLLKVERKVDFIAFKNNLGVIHIGNGEYLIDREDKIRLLNKDLNLQEKDISVYQPYELAVNSVIAEKNLFSEKAVFIYLSSINESIIGIKKLEELIPLLRVNPLKKFKNKKQTVWSVLMDLKSNERYSKLVDNYISKFNIQPEDLNLEYEISYKFKDILEVIMDILQVKIESSPSDIVESYAMDFKVSRGLIVDFDLKEENGSFYIDWQKALASLMSYRIAGDTDEIISFSLLESFSEFIERQVNTISSKFGTDKVIITGDLFSNLVLYGRLLKHLRRFNIYTNETLPIGKENLVFGGIFA
ncbi:MAG: hypothetical protein WHT47_01215 [Hydrogenothermaceae bacterium]